MYDFFNILMVEILFEAHCLISSLISSLYQLNEWIKMTFPFMDVTTGYQVSYWLIDKLHKLLEWLFATKKDRLGRKYIRQSCLQNWRRPM